MLVKILLLIFLNPVISVFSESLPRLNPRIAADFLFKERRISAAAENTNYFSLLKEPRGNLGADINFGVLLQPAVEAEKPAAPESPAPEKIADLPKIYPVRNFNAPDAEIDAKSYLLYDAERDLILYSKDIEEKMFIASLTKLMTAMVVLDFGKTDDIVVVSKAAVETEGVFGNLVVNEKISVKNLLHALLIESSNDAATALAEYITSLNPENAAGKTVSEYFVGLMNEKSAALGLKKTHFTTPSGLNGNYSTAFDLARLTKAAFDYPLLWEIMRLPSAVVYSADKKIAHRLTNSNKLLGFFPNILGGKTGYTEEAGECMILVQEIKQGQRNIFVILNSPDRFGEMLKFLKWSVEAFLW